MRRLRPAELKRWALCSDQGWKRREKMMKRYAYLIVWFLLVGAPLDPSSVAQRSSARQTRPTAFPAKPGFYIQFSMCHACTYSGWQKDTVSALGNAGIQALVSDDTGSGYHDTEQPYLALQSLQLRAVVGSQRITEDWFTPLYAGPFDSEEGARQVFSQLQSILKSALDESDRRGAQVGSEPYSREFRDCSGNHCALAGYSVRLVSVTSASAQPRRLVDPELNIGTLPEKAEFYETPNWCFFRRPSATPTTYIFFINQYEDPFTLRLKLDGSVRVLKLVSSTHVRGLKKGSSYTETYRSGDVTAHITYVVTKQYAEGTAHTATVVVAKGSRSKTVKTVGECG